MKASVFIATSLDGFIARENDDLDWLPGIEGGDSREDYGYGEFIRTVDVLVMGRRTYEKVLTFPEWPYGSLRVVVLTGRTDLPRTNSKVELLTGSPRKVLKQLADQGATHAYVDGGKTIQGFLRDGLIQHVTITRVPVLLGAGIPLFGPLEHDLALRHLGTTTYPNGLVQTRYEVIAGD